MLAFIVCRDKFIKEPEEFVNLLYWEIGIVSGVLDFESIDVWALSGYDIRQRVQAWIADRNTNRVETVLSEEFD